MFRVLFSCSGLVVCIGHLCPVTVCAGNMSGETTSNPVKIEHQSHNESKDKKVSGFIFSAVFVFESGSVLVVYVGIQFSTCLRVSQAEEKKVTADKPKEEVCYLSLSWSP